MEINGIRMKHCQTCKELLPADLKHFGHHATTRDRLTTNCRPCLVANQGKYKDAIKERVEQLEPAATLKRLPGESNMAYCRRHNQAFPIIRSAFARELVKDRLEVTERLVVL